MSDENFLKRWSQRKRESQVEGEEPAAEGPAVEPVPEAAEDALTPEEVAALPPVEEVEDPQLLKQFLRKGVPALMQRAAMRRMWLLNPAIRDYMDPARDYAWDWNTPGGMPGSGPLVPGESVMRMVERLMEGGKRAAPEGAAVETAEAEPAAEAPPAPSAEPARPVAAAETLADPAPAQGPRRRHGGAAPV